MFVVLHYPLSTVRQQLSQDHVLQVRERESYVRGTALSTRHCQTTAQPGSRPTRERERELCSWYCTIHSALSDNSSARMTSYKRERERERVMFVVLHYPLGTVRQQLSQDDVLQAREREREREICLWYCTIHSALSDNSSARITSYKRERERELCSWYCTIHSALSDNSSARMTSYKGERERVMFVVLHYPLGTVRQQLSQDHVLQGRERESYVRGTALSTRHCQTIAQPGWRPTSERERERERDMFVVLHYPLGTVRQQLSQDDVLQARERERELCSWYCTIHSALSDNSSARITSYKIERERELCSWYCTIHSALSDNSSARITSYKWERERVMFVVLHYPLGTVRQQLSQDHVLQERERESYVRGTALSTRHCQTTAQPGWRPTSERERERVMFVVLHYPLGTVRQQLSQDDVLQARERERERYVCGTALSTRHCQTIAQPGSRPTRERERERVMFVVLHYPLGTVRQ